MILGLICYIDCRAWLHLIISWFTQVSLSSVIGHPSSGLHNTCPDIVMAKFANQRRVQKSVLASKELLRFPSLFIG